MTGIVRAIDSGRLIQSANPDDPSHSPVSTKWELYVINVTEAQPDFIRGDVDGNGIVDISDLSFMIDLLLSHDEAPAAADCDLNNQFDISDVSALIDYLLTKTW